MVNVIYVGGDFLCFVVSPLVTPPFGTCAVIISRCVSPLRTFASCERAPRRRKRSRGTCSAIIDWAGNFAVSSPSKNGVLDFYCFEHRLAVELDGGVHAQIDQMRKDAVKEDYLRTLGIRSLRIPNAMVLDHPDEFVRTVVGAMGAVAKQARK